MIWDIDTADYTREPTCIEVNNYEEDTINPGKTQQF